jgi:hypothetical protein
VLLGADHMSGDLENIHKKCIAPMMGPGCAQGVLCLLTHLSSLFRGGGTHQSWGGGVEGTVALK